MIDKAYLSNLSKHWPLEKQEAEHAAKTPGWPKISSYRDKISAAKLRAHAAEALIDRATLFRPTDRIDQAETIWVASLAVFAWTEGDFRRVLSAALARSATIITHESGRVIRPGVSGQELLDVMDEFLRARRRPLIGGGQTVGAKASAIVRVADIKARIKLIEHDWPNEAFATADLLMRAGRKRDGERKITPLSYPTAVKYLGSRKVRLKAIKTGRELAERRKLNNAKRRRKQPAGD